MNDNTISQKLASFVNKLSYENFSTNQVYKLKMFFLDWLASAYAGQTQEPVKIVLDLVFALGGNPESTVIPADKKTSVLLAAFANGASSHMVEMDDLHRESILHPAAAIIPAIFAVAEKKGVSGKKIIEGIAAGYEAGIRVALGAGQGHYKFWHTTGTCGTFGAAAGASKILGLNENEIAWALGSAGTQASGLWEFLEENAMSKQLHAAKSCLNGVLSALLAERGFTGATKILEGKKGFYAAMTEDFDKEKCLKNIGSEFLFEQNSLKYYASCGHTHSAIEAAIMAKKSEDLKIDEIENINVYVYQAAIDLLGNVIPTTSFLAKFSLPFCVATAIKFGQAGLDDFCESRLVDPEIKNLMKRITIISDNELSLQYPRKWPARVNITTTKGSRVSGAIDYPKGDPENPLTETELTQKFLSLTKDLIPFKIAEKLIDRVMNLEKIKDIRELL